MSLLRLPGVDLTATVEVSDPSTEYSYTITHVSDNHTTTSQVTSDSNSKAIIYLPTQYDGQYSIAIDGEELFVDIERPYVDPNSKGTTNEEIQKYARDEELARAIIDSIVTQGFYYKKRVIETTGNGADYIPLWTNVRKLLKVYENNVLVYDVENPDNFDRAFEITDDKTAITQKSEELVNRGESAPLVLPAAASDWLDVKYIFRGFPKTFDYKLVVEEGYRNIPSDIVRATELLVEDISCGRLDYFKQYVSDYNTDQFKIKFDSKLFEGTGNIIVDKILSKYTKSIRTLGVL